MLIAKFINFETYNKNGFYLHSLKNLKLQLKNQRIFDILLSYFVIRNFRGTLLIGRMLKGCMVRIMLGMPVKDI